MRSERAPGEAIHGPGPPRLPRVVIAGSLLLCFGASDATAARAPLCSGGTFQVELAGPLVPSGAAPDRIAIGDDGVTGIASGCPEVPGRLRATGKGTKLKVRWTRKTALCAGLEKPAKLTARFDASCDLLSGAFRSRA